MATPSLRVLQLCADPGIAPGSTKGAAQHLRGIAAGLTAAGHSVVTFAARSAEAHFPVPVSPLLRLTAHEAERADVIYERYSLGHRAGLALARSTGTPLVLEVNAPLVDEATRHRPQSVKPNHAQVEAELLAEADLVVTVSSELTNWVRSRRRGTTVTIANGFEPSWFRPPSSSPQFPLVFLGHPKPWHGADRLPELLHRLAGRGHRPRLLVVGGGKGVEPLMARARQLGVVDQITVTGALPPAEATAKLAEASIGLAPYPRIDPFYFCPLKIADYLAAGLAVVSTSQGDIPAMVGDAGVTVDADDTEGLVGAIEDLLTSPAKRTKFGQTGRRRAIAHMTWDQVARRTEAALFSVAPRRTLTV